jgi:nicotinate dehydrogenase subunit A
MPEFQFSVNGKEITAQCDDPTMPLLYYLRNDLKLRGPRFGCGLGQCGACTVHLNGAAIRSCVYPIGGIKGNVTTLEGLGSPQALHPLQQAFIDEQALQCGYCINGMIMQAAAFLKRVPKPTEAQVRDALGANLCRCGTHLRIVRAIMRAAQ